MSIDFENKPLKNENGKVIRTADGKPILYKHFLNDLPDDEHEDKWSARERIRFYGRLGLKVPECLLKEVDDDNLDNNSDIS